MITAIVLAAGLSRRMAPRHKLLERLGDDSVVGRTVEAVAASRCDAVLVVVGHAAAHVAAALPRRDPPRWSLVEAQDHAAGLAASLRAGLAARPPGTRRLLVCLGDMPFVRTATIDRLIAASDGAPEDAIVVPTVDGRRGNPVLWGAAHFPALAALTGDRGGGALIASHPAKLVAVETGDPGILLDLDDDAALAAARRTLAPG